MSVRPLSLYVPKAPVTFKQSRGEDCFMGGQATVWAPLTAAPLDPQGKQLPSVTAGDLFCLECSDPTETPLQRIKLKGEKFTLLPFLLTVVS